MRGLSLCSPLRPWSSQCVYKRVGEPVESAKQSKYQCKYAMGKPVIASFTEFVEVRGEEREEAVVQ